MEKMTICTAKLPKTNTDKKNVRKISEVLLGLFSLGVCLITIGYCPHLYRQKKAVNEYDKETLATLVDKKILGENGKSHVVIWLDTDNDLKTIEGFCNMPDAKPEKALEIYNITNRTTKNIAEWKQITLPYKIHLCR